MSISDIAIIIPAYHEEETIPILIPRIRETLAKAPIIIVDDSEQSRSAPLGDWLQKQYPEIVLLNRKTKSGRGSAVLFGFKYALTHTTASSFIEMDADGSHNPNELVRLLEKRSRYDCVVGSRYLPASVITHWPLKRRILSKWINAILRISLGIPLSDFTNGMRVYSRNAAEFLVNASLKESGFIALSEWIVALRVNKFLIGEVATSFTDRTRGKSNAGIREHINALRGVLRLMISRYMH